MKFEIISVNADRLDEGTYVIELRQFPSFFDKLLGYKQRIMTFKGQAGAWYVPPSFRPASNNAVKFLNEIATSPSYAHLRTFKKAKADDDKSQQL
jgi:hypothetical protein